MTAILIAAFTLSIVIIGWLWAALDESEYRSRHLNQRYCDAMNVLAAKQNEIDERDGEIERLRRIRSEYVLRLMTDGPQTAGELRRQMGDN